jgi:hypothetical protein
MDHFDVIVVGGGPAGMMAAGRAAERGRRAVLLERGPSPGRKLLLTGNGRCNLTNSASPEEFLAAYGRKGGFLRHALSILGNEDLRRWFGARGVETVEESGGRVFPTGEARAVLQALLTYLEEGQVSIECGRRAASLLIEDGRLAGVQAAGRAWRAPCVILATGGLSYPSTGSTGDGYRLARQAGHTVNEPYPAIGGLETMLPRPQRLQGVSLREVVLRAVRENGRRLASARGDVVWTHYGVSGPAVFGVSNVVTQALRKGRPVWLEVDLVPSLPAGELERALAPDRARNATAAALLARWMPRSMARAIMEVSDLKPDARISALRVPQRQALAQNLKALRAEVTGPRPTEEAIVTGGGVRTAEVDGRTMQSHRMVGLYFAGEMLDVHGPTGGFNLQAAFSTGYLAGDSV